MSARLRGSEATISIAVDDGTGAFIPQVGSFFKVRDFRNTPRVDLVEEDYLGEVASDLDVQYHGFDGSFTIDMNDRSALDFLSNLVADEQNQVKPRAVLVMVQYKFRDGQLPIREVFSEAVMKPSEHGLGGRKEYIQTSFEFKAKQRQQFFAPS